MYVLPFHSFIILYIGQVLNTVTSINDTCVYEIVDTVMYEIIVYTYRGYYNICLLCKHRRMLSRVYLQ